MVTTGIPAMKDKVLERVLLARGGRRRGQLAAHAFRAIFKMIHIFAPGPGPGRPLLLRGTPASWETEPIPPQSQILGPSRLSLNK